MSTRQVVCKERTTVATKELLEALSKALDGNSTEEEIQKKITELGLSSNGEYKLTEIVDKVSSSSSEAGMESEDEALEANWIEALRQLAERLHDEEALQVIAAAKRSMLAAHSQVDIGSDKPQPRDINNNIINTSGTSFASVRRAEREEEKKRETELLKILNSLDVQEDPLPLSQSEDDKKIEDKGKKV